MDVGCYPMSMARLLVSEEPAEIKAAARMGDVDEVAVASLRFPGDCLATLATGVQVSSSFELRIWGSKGHIIVPAPWIIGSSEHKILLKQGELYVVPQGVYHWPEAEQECHILLIEPQGVVNTGESGGKLTAPQNVWI